MKKIPYSRQWIDKEDILAVSKTLKSDFITKGPKIDQFEKALADFTGAKYAVVFNSGTSALHASYFAIGLSRPWEFITSPLTFAATANAGLYLGAKPVFCDCNSETGNIDVSKIEDKLTKKTKMIVPVDYGGQPADLKSIHKVARIHNLFVVEDACQALGAEYNGKKIGCCEFSDICVFSFHPVKTITTGEGGAATTNNKTLYEKLLAFRTHGILKKQDWLYEMIYLGYNYRMTDFQAALGHSQLKKIERFVKRRREIALFYYQALKNNPFFDIPSENKNSAWHLYPIRLKTKYVSKKKQIFRDLIKQGIGVQVHHIPVYFHPFYRKLGITRGLCPAAEDFYKRVISIPIYPAMSDADAKYVVKTILGIFK